MTDYSITNLLQQVKVINSKYDSLAKLTGENFNVFKIMRIDRNEQYTHSAFIAELLNPKGCHEQDGIFLNLFIKYVNDINEKKILEFDLKYTNIIVEKNIGYISQDLTEGGRIDIYIEDKTNLIMVENKIYAGDQVNQLLRYYKHGKKANKSFNLIYLTLDDKLINDFTTGNVTDVKKYVTQITYKKHIIEWLEICKKETVDLPILRETITQYINLIKILTHQTTNHKMSTELVNTLTASSVNFNAAKSIVQEFEKAKELIYTSFWKKAISKLTENLGHEWVFNPIHYGFEIYNRNCNIVGLGIDTSREGKLYAGLWKARFGLYQNYIENKIKEIYGRDYIYNQYWINWENLGSFNLFETSMLNNLLPISDNEVINNEVDKVVQNLLEYFNKEQQRKYIEQISEYINSRYNDLLLMQNEVEIAWISKNLIRNEIYTEEGHVLFQEILLKDQKKLVIDTFLKDNKWIIEIFIRNIEVRTENDQILMDVPFFQSLDFSLFQRRNQRLIYKEFSEENVDEIVDTLKKIIECILLDL